MFWLLGTAFVWVLSPIMQRVIESRRQVYLLVGTKRCCVISLSEFDVMDD
jgi:hypothetical protein